MRPSRPKHRFWRVWGVSGERRGSRQSDRRRAGRSAWVLPAAERRAPQACCCHGLRRVRCGGLRSRRRNHIRGAGRRNPDGLHRRERNRRRRSRSRCGRNLGLRFRRFGGGCDKLRSRFRFCCCSGGTMVSARLTCRTRRAVHHDRSLIERGDRFGLWRIAGQRNTWPRRCRPQQQLWQRACSGDNERHHRNRAAPEPLLDHALSPRGAICPGANQPVAQSQPRQGITSRRRECGAPWPMLRRSRDDQVAYGEPRTTPSRKNTRYGVVPLALPSLARQRPFVHSVPPCAGTASNSTLLW